MNPVTFLNKNAVFTTRLYAFATGVAMETASRQLKRFASDDAIRLLTRGIWAQPYHPYFSAYGAVPYLLGNEQGYVSFLTALHRHGLISQIPRTIQIATTGRGRKLSTPIGNYELFHLEPSLMREGIDQHDGKLSYNIACAEKALIDTLHLSTRKGRRFASFPELDLDLLDKKKLKALLQSLKPETQNRVKKRLQKWKL